MTALESELRHDYSFFPYMTMQSSLTIYLSPTILLWITLVDFTCHRQRFCVKNSNYLYYMAELGFRYLRETTHFDWLLNGPTFYDIRPTGPIRFLFRTGKSWREKSLSLF